MTYARTSLLFLFLTLAMSPASLFACSMDNTCGGGMTAEECHQKVVSLRKRKYNTAAVDNYSTSISEKRPATSSGYREKASRTR